MIIDGHTHINRKSWEAGGGLSDFDKNGVDLIIGMTFDFALCPSPGKPEFWKARNEELAEISAESNGRMVALCSVHPKDGTAAILEIQRAVNERKMMGISAQSGFS